MPRDRTLVALVGWAASHVEAGGVAGMAVAILILILILILGLGLGLVLEVPRGDRKRRTTSHYSENGRR